MISFTARTPVDLIAFAPVALGFLPSESLVLLTFGGPQPFHARVDLPSPGEVDEALEFLVGPATAHAARQVVLFAWTEDEAAAAAVLDTALPAFLGRAIDVIALAQVGESQFRLREPDGWGDPEPYDLATHPITAQAVAQGRVTLASRESLADTVRPDPDAVARVAEALSAQRGPALDRSPGRAADWVIDTVQGESPGDEALARALQLLAEERVLRAVAARQRRDTAHEAVPAWREAVRRSPDSHLEPSAAVLALCAWLSGDGALAWCALDRAAGSGSDPGPLSAVVARFLVDAVPPTNWGATQEAG